MSKRVKSFSQYLSEGYKHLVEDEVDDLPSDLGNKKETDKEGTNQKGSDKSDDIEEVPDKLDNKGEDKKNSDKKEGDEKQKSSVTDRYKINMEWRSNDSFVSSYNTYVTCFVEAVNSLDAIAAISTSIDPEFPACKSYKKERYNLATIVDKNQSAISGTWDKMAGIAGSFSGIVKDTVNKMDVYKKYFEDKKKLDEEREGKNGPKLKEDVYQEELKKLKEKYSAMIDPGQIHTLNKLNSAIQLYRNAISKFKAGAEAEIKFIEEKQDQDFLEAFYSKISSGMENIILSKDLEGEKKESEDFSSYMESILENFGGFLNSAKGFAKGVETGIKDAFKGGPKQEKVDDTKDERSIVYAAENLKGQLINAASEIDNVINFKKNFMYSGGDKADQASKISADEAKSQASEMISFIQESFKYVVTVKDLVKDGSTSFKSINDKLNEIAKQLAIIGRKGGVLDKWKDEVLGKGGVGKGRGRIESAGFLQKGRELMQAAAALQAEVSNQEKIEKRYEDREAGKVFKRAVAALKGEDENKKESLIKKKSDVKTFSRDDKNADKDIVKTFQQRLIDLGKLPTGNPNGEFDEDTKNAAKQAMIYIGDLSGKVYADTDEAFQDFQRDLGIYSENKEKIRKELGF